VLREGGLVITERKGQEIYYELNTSVFQDLVRHLMEWVQPSARVPLPRTRRSQES
jgi:DNA-binding transcriptional ArsR family regulator